MSFVEFKKEEEYIYDESQEVSLGMQERWTQKFYKIFPALSSRNYQLYFTGQLISVIGTWLQMIAQGWLVLKLTDSAFLLGLVSAVASLPTLLFSLFGGVVIDKFSRRKIIIFTQSSAMILALIMGLLTVFKLINIWEIMILAFLLGCVTAIDWPARQSFVVEMVGKDDMASAIAMNSGLFNGARVIGPSIAGFLIAIVGTGGAFLLNGFSYIAVIAALFAIKVKPHISDIHPHPLRAIKDGVKYSLRHPVIRTLLIFIGITSIFGWSYSTILPVVAQDIFHQGVTGLGYIFAASGLGAFCATVLVSANSKNSNSLLFILGGNTVFAVSIVLFALTRNIYLAYFFLFMAGFGLLCQSSTINSTIQRMVKEKYRGRVMSIYTLMFLGMGLIGNLQIGYLSEHFGTSFALILGAVVIFIFGVLIYLTRGRIKEAYEIYKKEE